MIAKGARKLLSGFLSLALLVWSQAFYGYQADSTPSSSQTESSGTTDAAPMTADELDHLVSPIALYPDALVAQVLGASTYPDQIAVASYWLKQNKNLTGKALTKAVDKQSWDPSVKALSQFPSVLDDMANNLSWTSTLGQAYHNQKSDVMAAIQAMRAKAKAAGNLNSGSQIKVVQQSPQTIVIEPANPQIVYVPQYNPAVIYGVPYTPPGYTAGDLAAASVLSFGAGIAVGALMAGGSSWGWGAWGCNWYGGAVVYNHTTFVGNTAWHGGYYGGYGYHAGGPYGGASAYHGAYGSAASYHGYGPNGAYHTGSAYNTAWGSGASHTTYGPGGAAHTSGTGYNATTGGNYHYGASSNAFGGSTYHGTSSTGEHYYGGTTAGGQHWGGSSSSDWASRADSNRGWSSMRSSGFSGGRFGGGGFGGGHFGGGFRR